MRIGELSARTGVSRRLLRYYEEQGLLSSEREHNGYRVYDARTPERVEQIKGLLAAGLPTRIIALVLPCLEVAGVLLCEEDASPAVLDALEGELERMDARIAMLQRHRDAMSTYLDSAARVSRDPRVRAAS